MVNLSPIHYSTVDHDNGYQTLTGILRENGIVLVDQIRSSNEFLALCRNLGRIEPDKDAQPDGLTELSTNDYISGKEGYLSSNSEEVHLHTDDTTNERPADLGLLYCMEPARSGGSSIVVDGKDLYRSLETHYPDVLEILSAPRTIIFGDQGRQFTGSAFGRAPDGRLFVRFRLDRLAYFSSPVASIIPDLQNVLDKLSFMVELQRGQAYIIQNGRMLHSRTPFIGGRKMYHCLVRVAENNQAMSVLRFGFDL